jgi:hypothetical protein
MSMQARGEPAPPISVHIGRIIIRSRNRAELSRRTFGTLILPFANCFPIASEARQTRPTYRTPCSSGRPYRRGHFAFLCRCGLTATLAGIRPR